jgi:hypothetical protein
MRHGNRILRMLRSININGFDRRVAVIAKFKMQNAWADSQ